MGDGNVVLILYREFVTILKYYFEIFDSYILYILCLLVYYILHLYFEYTESSLYNSPEGYNKTYRTGNASKAVVVYSSYKVKLILGRRHSVLFLYPGFTSSHIRAVKSLLNVTNIFDM
jgi:hypothetical protein